MEDLVDELLFTMTLILIRFGFDSCFEIMMIVKSEGRLMVVERYILRVTHLASTVYKGAKRSSIIK